MKELEVVKECAAIDHDATYEPNSLRISWKELKEAPIGTVWTVDEQDRYPNAEDYWKETYTKIYEEENGCLVKHYIEPHGSRDEDPESNERTTLVWFEWR